MSLIHWVAASLGCTCPLNSPGCILATRRSGLNLTNIDSRLCSDSPDYGFVPMNEHLPQYAKSEL